MATASILRPHPRCAGVFKLPFQAHLRIVRNIASSHPKNHHIEHEVVQILDSEGNLSERQRLSSILASVNLDTHVVRLFSKYPPTVVIASKIEEKMRRLEKKAGKKLVVERRKLVIKERQFTWVTAGPDLQHKLQCIRDDLEKGNARLDIQFLPKAGVRSPPLEEMKKRLDDVAAMLEDVSNEWKDKTFQRGGATLFLQSKVKKKIAMPSKEELEEVAKQKLEAHLDRVQSQRKKREEVLKQHDRTS
ncbi:hypothetical protein BYT27DRAFT_7195291 [Phlegmacium glaucopus]|nr:hypothetical protein BYT27DRAFT_7195291 [Phlegmacium glaucopus]